jgi:hypothetical protein
VGSVTAEDAAGGTTPPHTLGAARSSLVAASARLLRLPRRQPALRLTSGGKRRCVGASSSNADCVGDHVPWSTAEPRNARNAERAIPNRAKRSPAARALSALTPMRTSPIGVAPDACLCTRAFRSGLLPTGRSRLELLLESLHVLWHLARSLSPHDEWNQELPDPMAGEVQLDRHPRL